MSKTVNICDVCNEIFAGGDAPKNNMSQAQNERYFIPIFSNGEENEGLYGYTDKARVTQPSITVSARGTIGYTAIRNTPFVPIVRLITLTPNPEHIDINYLYYAMRNYKFDGSGTSIPQLTVPSIKKYSFPLPTMEEQKRIALLLDNLCELIEKRKKQLNKLDKLVKARFVELFGDPETNPKGFKKVLLSDIAEYFNGLTYSPDKVNNDGTIVLRSSNIQNSQLDFADTVRVDCPIKEKLYVKNNDILMCSRNGSARLVGKVALINNLSEPMTFGAFMMIIRSKYYSYLMTYFQMDAFRRQIAIGATTTINQITGNMLNKISLPVPDMADINEFATFVEQVDKLKVAVQKALDEAQTLFDSLMQQYFG